MRRAERRIVRLRDLSSDDLPLYVAIHCDPEMMAELGGPAPHEGQAEKLARDVASVERDEAWVLVIAPDDDPAAAAGTVSVWSHDADGESIDEIGWMVLPRYQGRGIGSAAVREVLERARATGRWRVLHAYPPVTNDRSNAMCRNMGFERLEERDFVFAGRVLRCNHWRLDLPRPETAEPLTRRPSSIRETSMPRVYSDAVAVLGGELAVPCTRDPLQRG